MTKNKTMPKNQEIYLNSSEHIFDLSFSDNLCYQNMQDQIILCFAQ